MRSACLLSAAILSACLSANAYAEDLPKGTVIAWVPPKEAVDEAAGKVKIPRGWKECEFNTDPAQKETGQFLYGGSVAVYIDRMKKSGGDHMGGGRPTHAHGVTISPHGKNDNYDKGGNKDAADAHVQHTADVSNESHIPPYATVIWLCKG